MQYVATLSIPEIIERAQKLETNEEKARFIKMYRNSNLRWFVYRLYNNDDVQEKNIKVPDYKPSHYPVGMNPVSFKQAIQRFENVVKLWESNPKRADNVLFMILEGVSPEEAKLFIMIIQGKKKFEGISKSVWKEVYPDLFQ